MTMSNFAHALSRAQSSFTLMTAFSLLTVVLLAGVGLSAFFPLALTILLGLLAVGCLLLAWWMHGLWRYWDRQCRRDIDQSLRELHTDHVQG